MIQLLQGDCLELMKDIQDKSIDMILADLPFGTTCCKWDSVIPFEPLWEQYKRIIKDHGAILLFSQMSFSAKLVMSNISMFRYEWIWKKNKGTGFLNVNRMPLKCHENILVFYKKLPTYNPQKTKGRPYSCVAGRKSDLYGKFQEHQITHNNGYRYPNDVLEFRKDELGIHPTAKPVTLLEYLIKTYTNEGETVLDNCMGSGSCGVACRNTNRNFIGMELDKEYFEIAKKRIEQ